VSLVEYKKKDHLVIITINRPDKSNALTPELLIEMRESWIRYRDDDDAWLAVFTGAGRAFSAGLDKSWIVQGLEGQDFLNVFVNTISKDPYWSGDLDKPTIVAVNGPALGPGLDLVLKADLRIAGESAKFQISEVALGGILVLWDNLPYAIAAELMSGSVLTARRAYEVGMVNKVVPDGQLMDAAMEMAEQLFSMAPLSLYHSLKTLREMKKATIPLPLNLIRSSLISDYTTLLGRELIKTQDWKEASTALLEKRKPVFKKR
jgi:enoyl-CoA hydratase/carnithine racemase